MEAAEASPVTTEQPKTDLAVGVNKAVDVVKEAVGSQVAPKKEGPKGPYFQVLCHDKTGSTYVRDKYEFIIQNGDLYVNELPGQLRLVYAAGYWQSVRVVG